MQDEQNSKVMQSKSGHGGARPGAGRPKKIEDGVFDGLYWGANYQRLHRMTAEKLNLGRRETLEKALEELADRIGIDVKSFLSEGANDEK